MRRLLPEPRWRVYQTTLSLCSKLAITKQSKIRQKSLQKKHFRIFGLGIKFDHEAKASAPASSLVDNRPANGAPRL